MIVESIQALKRLGIDIALTSMPGDPIHPGHVSCLQAMRSAVAYYRKSHGIDGTPFATACLVNDDNFLISKKGIAFMPLADRIEIIDNIKNGPDYVVGFTPTLPGDMSVSEAIEVIKPKYFIKGGDRKADNTLPEWNACHNVGCAILDHVGLEKRWSSSDYLTRYANFVKSRVLESICLQFPEK